MELKTSLDLAPAGDRARQVLGGDSDRLHQMPAEREADPVHDLVRVDRGQHHLSGASFRLEGRRLRATHHAPPRVPHLARHWLPDLRNLHQLLLSAHAHADLLLENLPGE